MQETKARITIKDHEEDFPNKNLRSPVLVKSAK